MMDALARSAEQRDWQALPEGVLQHVFYRASCCQTPGTCVAAPVCRSWRSAAAGCSRLRLLYHAGYKPADQSFIDWVQRNSGQLGSLTLSSSDKEVVKGLAEAATTAQAAGRPLQLHTLRLLGWGVSVFTTGQLLTALPHLRCLQLGMHLSNGPNSARAGSAVVLQALAPLQQATHLEELYLLAPSLGFKTIPMNKLLPPSLKRLSWMYYFSAPSQDLSHLTQCTFLHLASCSSLSSSHLPPRLQELQLAESGTALEVVEEQKEVVMSWSLNIQEEGVQQLLTRLPNLTSVHVVDQHMCSPAAQAALKTAGKLSALTVFGGIMPPGGALQVLQQAVATAASMRHLRRLHLQLHTDSLLERQMGLAALKQLTQLRVSIGYSDDIVEQRQRVWLQEVGTLQGLRWLSLPNVFLEEPQAWLGELQQLRVLVLHGMDDTYTEYGSDDPCPDEYYRSRSAAISNPWLKGFIQQALPQSLRVLGLSGMTAAQAATWQLRRHMQQRLGSSGCEVVVGVDLDEVCDPVQQLAGVPVAPHQVLSCQA
jgi:hypothetical protein